MLEFTQDEARKIAVTALGQSPSLIKYTTRLVYPYDGPLGRLAVYLHQDGATCEVTVTEADQEQLTEAPLSGSGTTPFLAVVAALTGQSTPTFNTEPNDLLF